MNERRELFNRYYRLTQEQEQAILSRDMGGLEALLDEKNRLIEQIDSLSERIGSRNDSLLNEMIIKIAALERKNIARARERLAGLRREMAETKRRRECIGRYAR